jgi:hypothetical protein
VGGHANLSGEGRGGFGATGFAVAPDDTDLPGDSPWVGREVGSTRRDWQPGSVVRGWVVTGEVIFPAPFPFKTLVKPQIGTNASGTWPGEFPGTRPPKGLACGGRVGCPHDENSPNRQQRFCPQAPSKCSPQRGHPRHFPRVGTLAHLPSDRGRWTTAPTGPPPARAAPHHAHPSTTKNCMPLEEPAEAKVCREVVNYFFG